MFKRIHVFISGDVQGVFFRDNIKRIALSLKIGGWARNLHNGKVEAIFEGEESSINKLIEFCKTGPSAAKVEKVEKTEERPTNAFGSFEIRY